MGNNLEIIKEYLGKKRSDTLTNDDVCMINSVMWSLKSKDPSTQVGAYVVGKDGRVLSAGYNGTPNGWSDDDFPWRNDVKEIGEENTKYPYVIHAEMNSIMNYKGSLKDFNNATIYVTLFPCVNCAKLIVQSGIKRVVYLHDDRKDTMDNICAKLLLKKCGVEIVDYSVLKTIYGIDLSLNSEKKDSAEIKKLEKK